MNKTGDKTEKIVTLGTVILIGVVISCVIMFKLFWKDPPIQIPKPNIQLQTQTVHGITYTLRNASYLDHKLIIGYEVEGGSFARNGFRCSFYSQGKLIDDSTGGREYELGNQHYYYTAETDTDLRDLPDPVDLMIQILARSDPFQAFDSTVKFHLTLKKEQKGFEE